MVETLSKSKFGNVVYGFGPVKSFADGRFPEDPSQAQRFASLIGGFGAMLILSLAIVLMMPMPSGGGSRSGSKSGSSSVNVEKLARCYKRNGVVGRMAGCRGGENSMQCARRQCGRWNKQAYNKALYD